MKSLKLLFSLLFLSMFVLTSCNDDPDEAELTYEILGDWKIESMDYTVTSSLSGSLLGVPFDQSSTTEGEMKNSDAFVNFSDNSYKATGSYNIEATASTEDVFGSVETSDQGSTVSNLNSLGSYTRDGNVLTLAGNLLEFDFAAVDFSGFSGLGDLEIPEFNLNSQESVGEITSYNGSEMTIVFDNDETTDIDGVGSSTMIRQTVVLAKQ